MTHPSQLQHPTAILKSEHHTILRVITVLERLVARSERGDGFEHAAMHQCVEFFRLFADANAQADLDQLAALAIERTGLIYGLRIRPDFAAAHYELGALLVERGLVDEGIYHLRECLHLNPQYGDAYYNLAVALATLGAFDEAKAEIENAISLQPGDEQTQQFRAWLGSLMREEQREAERAVGARDGSR